MAKGAFYFPFYYQRFLASCSDWDDDEVGAYIKLLIYQFDKGSIPNDMKRLAKIGNSVKKNWPLLKTKFTELPNGTLINEVMDAIRDKHLEKKEKNADNGSKGGRPKLIKNAAELEPNGYDKNNQTVIHTNMDIGLLGNGSSEKGTITQNMMGSGKKDFLSNQAWKEQFCMTKKISMPELEAIQKEFIADADLKGEFVDNYKRYFTNWYNKNQPTAKLSGAKKMVQ